MNYKFAYRSCSRQRGVVLLIALVVLIAMTLAGFALVRSTTTTNLIAGNLAFKQAATNAGDAGIERAIKYLVDSGESLYTDHPEMGYSAKNYDPEPGESWVDFWNRLAKQEDGLLPQPYPQSNPIKDEANNRLYYVIHRLCEEAGKPGSVRCAPPPKPNTSSAGTGGGIANMVPNNGPVYYRITVRVEGPRNTQSYIQAIVSLS